ncbi:hypothetical protein OU798_08040 [Prolixibacteraceae bacterium Z1-6]|uniref:DUF4402 domain-containing protein n=1 Tax=Draconibacterium aestuarii TaxID=2998507 RepID=A0A9X3FCB9_9BACT|nr:hypothetical protein [Prolixibacteraceae bacterium Z1-6]
MGTILKRLLLLLIGVNVFATGAKAQLNTGGELEVNFLIPPIALLDIEPGINNTIYFSVSSAIESGASPQIENTNNESLWLNYSSALEGNLGSRIIIAQIAGENLPEGITLNVEASQYSGVGDGQFGQPTGKVALSTQPRTILTGVGNCFTGDGVGNGHSLTFSIEVEDYSKISSVGESSFTILYTISDN